MSTKSKQLQGTNANGVLRRKAEHRNQIWTYDFTMDQTADGKRLKLMPVVDEYTRECLTIEVERSRSAEDVISAMGYLFQVHGEPEFIRSDNDPELTIDSALPR